MQNLISKNIQLMQKNKALRNELKQAIAITKEQIKTIIKTKEQVKCLTN